MASAKIFWLASKVYYYATVIKSGNWRPFSTSHTSNHQKSIYLPNVVGMDPSTRSAKFEAKQPRISASGGLRVYVAYVVNFTRPPKVPHEAAWSQTLFGNYLGP